MTIEGPNTPPEPPLPMVRPVVTILPTATARRINANRRPVLPFHVSFDGFFDDSVTEGQDGEDPGPRPGDSYNATPIRALGKALMAGAEVGPHRQPPK